MEIRMITTTGDGESQFKTLSLQPDAEGIENQLINLYPEITFQTFEGFGGAITDSAGYVYSLMNDDQKKLLINSYFSREEMKYGIVRIHMDSCDFSTEMYEAMSDPEDAELHSFSFERTEKYIIPMLEDAQKAAEKPLKLMLSPWSPPAFMKTNGSRKHGGKLKPEYRKMWAKYLCRYITEFKTKGYNVQRISLQNEPKAAQTWDSCLFTAEEERVFLRDYLYPALQEHGLSDVEVFIWDHNKERCYERVRDTVGDDTRQMVSGVACHWYSGDHFESLDLVQKQFPNLKLIISESCIEYRWYAAEDAFGNAGKLSHEIIGDLNHGICAFYDWNLLLDETGGPNHVNNLCEAPYLYDRKKKELQPRLIQKHFYHFSHNIVPGAKRIAHSRYTDQIDVTAFLNPDGTIAVVLLNRTNTDIPVVLRINGQIASIALKAKSISSGIIS